MRLDRIRSGLRSQRYGIAMLALVIAVVGPANAASGLSSATSSVSNALKLAKKADKRSKKALKTAKEASAKTGPQGPAGAQGAKGDAGPGGFTETLPSGKTLRGVYSVRFLASGNEAYEDPISFGFVLSSPPTTHFISTGSVPQCPGNSGNPQANPGHLCVYEVSGSNRASVGIFDASFAGGASTFGARIVTNAVDPGQGGSFGSWAVTAP